MSRFGAPLLIFVLALAPSLPALPADPPAGYLTAFVCEPVAKPLRVSSTILDNTDENIRLHGLLLKRLAANHVTVGPDAALTMSFDVRRVREAARRKPGDMIDVRVGEDEERIGQEGFAKIHMNIWSNARDSVLGGRRDTLESALVDRLRISVTINSKADGRCVWRGEVVQNLDGRDARRTATRMIPILADSVGSAVSQKPIDID